MPIRFLLVIVAILLGTVPIAGAQTTTTTNYSITITITPAIASVNLSSTSLTTTGVNNAGATIGAITVTTNPAGGNYTGAITLGGANASSFALTNGGVLPCNLVVGPANLAAGAYQITLSATQ
jgi:Flp pilus assembly protein TadG